MKRSLAIAIAIVSISFGLAISSPSQENIESRQVNIWSDGTRLSGNLFFPKNMKEEEIRKRRGCEIPDCPACESEIPAYLDLLKREIREAVYETSPIIPKGGAIVDSIFRKRNIKEKRWQIRIVIFAIKI